jgi:lysozyme
MQTKITTTSKKGIDLIKSHEGFSSKPYMCPANVCTIGFGTTRYPNGTKISMNDAPISEAKALEYLIFDMKAFERNVDAYCRDDINQNQFDALVSFCYNVGPNALKSSTLLKKVNINPSDPTIANEFAKWNKGGGKVLKGLIRRRKEESELYFT